MPGAVRTREVKPAAYLRHLLKFAYKKSDGTWYYPFAAHPRFAFWALNQRQRHKALKLADVTIHKSQGQTLDKAVVDIRGSDWCVGLKFVALSRVKKLSDLVIYRIH